MKLFQQNDLYNWWVRACGLVLSPDALTPVTGQGGYAGLIFNRDTGGLIVSPPHGEGTILASGARTATPTIADLKNPGCRGVLVIIDVTAGSGLSLTPKIQAKDPVSGKYVDLVTGAAITGVSTVALRVYPGLTAAANLTVSDILPRTWRVNVAHGNATSGTYSIGYSYLP